MRVGAAEGVEIGRGAFPRLATSLAGRAWAWASNKFTRPSWITRLSDSGSRSNSSLQALWALLRRALRPPRRHGRRRTRPLGGCGEWRSLAQRPADTRLGVGAAPPALAVRVCAISAAPGFAGEGNRAGCGAHQRRSPAARLQSAIVCARSLTLRRRLYFGALRPRTLATSLTSRAFGVFGWAARCLLSHSEGGSV